MEHVWSKTYKLKCYELILFSWLQRYDNRYLELYAFIFRNNILDVLFAAKTIL